MRKCCLMFGSIMIWSLISSIYHCTGLFALRGYDAKIRDQIIRGGILQRKLGAIAIEGRHLRRDDSSIRCSSNGDWDKLQHHAGDVVEFCCDNGTSSTLGVIADDGQHIYSLCLRNGDSSVNNQMREPADSISVDTLNFETMSNMHSPGDFLEEDIVLYYNEDIEPVQISSSSRVLRIIDAARYSQRIVEDRISNPHGEHAEDVWLLDRNFLFSLLARSTRLVITIGEGH